MIQNLNFNKYYKLFNIISVILVILSLISILFKGLNYGVDFKGGTLIELRINDNQTPISNLRSAFNYMNLGDVAIKNFGNDNDYLMISKINSSLSSFDPNNESYSQNCK